MRARDRSLGLFVGGPTGADQWNTTIVLLTEAGFWLPQPIRAKHPWITTVLARIASPRQPATATLYIHFV
jgi:hypothetical protein